METYWWYIFKVSICIIVFYTFYFVVLRKCTFFLLNRLYLILGLILSFVIPALNFSIFKSQSNSTFSTMIQPFLIDPEYVLFQPQNLSDYVTTTDYSIILSIIYFGGISFLFFRILFSIMRIIRIRNNSEIFQLGHKEIIKTDSNQPFSFFNMIFLPKDGTNQLIIEHELVHVKQCHWCDLILIEIVSVLLWFNPFVILYKKSLKLQHEYLADASVVKDKNRIESYLNCMLTHIQVMNYNGMTSQFYCKTIKNRIIMITKNKTSNKYLGTYLFMLPLICFMLFVFSDNNIILAQDNEITQRNEIIQNNQAQPSIYPLDSKKIKRISAEYGEQKNSQTNTTRFHKGIDFSISEGEKVMSTADGIVVEAKYDSKRGNYIIVRHDGVFSTFYSHLKSISVQSGDKLEKGQTIGYVGNTGMSTGPHLHYEVFRNCKNVNPKDYLPE